MIEPGADQAWLDRRGLSFALLRPDRFVFAAGGVDEVLPAVQAWRRLVGGTRLAATT